MIRQAAGFPLHCDRAAYEGFYKAVVRLDTTADLLRAASAISRHAFHDDSSAARVPARLGQLARRVRTRVRSHCEAALLAHLHDELFETQGFRGADSPTALHCYLPQVLELREGLPETLGLLYKGVAERLGLVADGVAVMNHFWIRVTTARGHFYVDPAARGRVRSSDEVLRMSLVAADGESLGPCSPERWLRRLLSQLQRLFATDDRLHDLNAMVELQRLLDRAAC